MITPSTAPLDGQHGDVVALLRTGSIAVHLAGHQFYQLAGTVIRLLRHKLRHVASAKHLVGLVTGLAQSVGIEKQRVAGLQIGLLPLELPV